jgi:UDP-N-acetylmuramyl pentapeptide phosphotransferase/UDP-N-acetylglucosamine-1-phosphate transferase
MAQHLTTFGALAVSAGLLCWLLTGLYRRAMVANGRLEAPNARSMHAVPVPVGAGVAIVAVALGLWPLSQGLALRSQGIVLCAALAGLAALSWADDRHGLSPGLRLSAQALAIAALLVLLEPELRVLPALPLAVERVLLGLAWLWFVNLFNFMDGIDGLAGSEAIAVGAGYLAIAAVANLPGPLSELALIAAAATGGYLAWNWHPARVFMGDAGSIPLGFLLGWLMIDLALRGAWAAAVILPLYFAADATLTLVKRVLRRQKPWQAHRDHVYQRAVLGEATPSGVVWRVNAANAALLVLAVVSLRYPAIALAGAAGVVTALLIALEGLACRRGDSPLDGEGSPQASRRSSFQRERGGGPSSDW